MYETADCLFELGTEELPPRALKKLAESLGQIIGVGLDKAGLVYTEITTYATPRRLAVLIKALSKHQPEQIIKRRGPALSAAFDKTGIPTKAGLGFARSCGSDINDLEHLKTEKGAWLLFRLSKPGQSTVKLLPTIIIHALTELPIPKKMRWGSANIEFVRPIHWAILLLGDTLIETEILGQKTGRESRGHRFHYPKSISISNPNEYVERLENPGFVIADFEKRREKIRNQVEMAAKVLGGKAILDDNLLDEVTGIVEWPVPVIGHFNPKFLEVPSEVLIATLQGKQKYFPVIDEIGNLLPHFITISNIESRSPVKVQEGNERVIRPRLTDAAFFWDQDRRRSLASRIEDLKRVIFHEKLGTLYEKTLRIQALTVFITELLGISDKDTKRAALLSKCDLLTDMVGEFPELQGTLGYHYARYDQESEEVAQALQEYYLPRFAGDQLPQSLIGQLLAISDRLDTLVGVFGIGASPTGDADPFGLRRAALGALRILIEKEFDLDLIKLLTKMVSIFQKNAPHLSLKINLVNEVYLFMIDRLRAYYLDQGLNTDTFEAVVILQPTHPFDFHRRLQAIHAFRAFPQAVSLIAAHKRIHNILRQNKDIFIPQTIDETFLQHPAEHALVKRLKELTQKSVPLLHQREYQSILVLFSKCKEEVDTFFESVHIMVEDEKIKHNRLAILKGLGDLFLKVADISLLEIKN